MYKSNKKDIFCSITKSFPWDKVSPEIINVHIELLDLPVRAFNFLVQSEIRTVGDILRAASINKIYAFKNAGKKTFDDIEKSLTKLPALNLTRLVRHRDIEPADSDMQRIYAELRILLSRSTQADAQLTNYDKPEPTQVLASFSEPANLSFSDDLQFLLSGIREEHLVYLKERYGYITGKMKTLEQVGRIFGVTRERVRQITVKVARIIKRKGGTSRNSLNNILDNMERVVSSYQGIVSINDLAKDDYFSTVNREQISFLTNMLLEVYDERYRKHEKFFFSFLDDVELDSINNRLQSSILKCRFPISEHDLLKHISTDVGTVSEDYIAYYLTNTARIVTFGDSVVSLGRLSMPEQVAMILKNIDRPLHFTEIADLYKKHYGNSLSRAEDLPRTIHTRISTSALFIIVDPGTFILRDRFIVPDNISEIVEETSRILGDLDGISNTRFILQELRNRKVKTGVLNPYNLKPLLLEYPGFISYMSRPRYLVPVQSQVMETTIVSILLLPYF